MRWIKRLTMIGLMCSILAFSVPVHAETQISNIPYSTWTIGFDGDFVRTANAYEGTFVLNRGFLSPRDIFIRDDSVYIADTGNARIYVYDIETTIDRIITHELIKEPTGIFVTEDHHLYIADATSDMILVFDENDQLIHQYGRPSEPLFGEQSVYEPRKVVVDSRGNIYIVSDAGINGIIQLDSEGRFLGFFGINKVNITLELLFKRALMSEEQKEKFASLTPKSTTNLAIDVQGLIYTVIKNEYVTPLKKLNIEGNNILEGIMIADPNYEDITIDTYGNIYTVSQDPDSRGVIGVHDSFGNLLFKFGRQEANSLRLGEFAGATGVSVDQYGDIWVLDGLGNNVQVFSKTEFATSVLTGIELYRIGQYDESAVYFQEIIRQNSLFALAHSRLGKYYERNEDFDNALLSYRIANNKTGYSNAYWEVRDAWINQNIVWLMIVMGAGLIGWSIFKRTPAYETYISKKVLIQDKINQYTFVGEFKLMLHMLKHPIDAIYDIKFKQKIRVKTAIIMYVVFVLINIFSDYYIKGYLFRSNIQDMVFFYEVLKWSVPLLLFGLGNYLISTLQNGEAFYRDLFIGTIVALFPIFLFKIPIDLLSNVLTYNEAFIYNFAYMIMIGWSVIMLLIMIKELNNFKYGELLVNLLLTIFIMVIMIVLYLIVSILSSQLINFVVNLVKEVFA
ncbi:MAG TPA: NHL repeat-containing protein [Acholeplasmataceae bacterium]|nr:NHL repeat-containing protein [Acholeplasmataceae bacterium]